MKKRNRILLAGLLIAALVGFAWLVLLPHEPVYQGKPLSVWLDQYGTNHWMRPDGDLDKQAQAAIRHIGTNAIPIYLRLMKTRESPLKLKLMALVPKKWQAGFHLPDALAYRNEIHRCRVLGAFGIVALGPDAKSVVPTLMGLLNEKNDDIRDDAVFALRSLGPVARDALPSLIKCVKDLNSGVRFNAILSLGEIHQEPEQVVPILTGCLDNKDLSVRYPAVWSLRQFGTQAKSAVPKLLGLLNDADAAVRSEATNALIAIGPEAAAKAGVK